MGKNKEERKKIDCPFISNKAFSSLKKILCLIKDLSQIFFVISIKGIESSQNNIHHL